MTWLLVRPKAADSPTWKKAWAFVSSSEVPAAPIEVGVLEAPDIQFLA